MPRLDVIVNKGRNKSGSSNLNYYAIKDNIHIMDNHLGAIVSLYEIGMNSKEIIFYHLDRHYDLGGLNCYHDKYILGEKQIPEVSVLDSIKAPSECNVFLWDNYIHLFYSKFYNKIKETYFITHQTTEKNWDWIEFEELTPFELIKYHVAGKGAILNIDIDYFFHETKEGIIYEAFSDSFLDDFKIWLSNNMKKFDLIIVALSPECCGGWNQSIEMFEKLFPELNLNI